MDILYTCNDNYIWLMYVSIKSLFTENSNTSNINVHVISDDITTDNKKLVEELIQSFNAKVFFYDIPQFNVDENCFGRWPKIAFARLFCHKVLPKSITHLLYLDCDTIIKGNIEELFEIESDKMFNGVLDCISGSYKKNIGLKKESSYINAGVLLINVDKLRQVDVDDLINTFVAKYKRRISYADQDILNGCFNDDIGILDPKYDVMTIEFCYSYKEILKLRSSKIYYDKMLIENAVEKPVIIHYTTNLLTIRPWYSNSNHPKKYDFISILNDTPFESYCLKEFKFYGKKNIFIKLCMKLPKFIYLRILGFVHSKIVPFLKRM